MGEGVGDKAGALLAKAVTTLATNAALQAHERDDVSIKEVTDLARAARAAMQARTMSLREREAIEDAARRKLLEEQKAKIDAMGSKGGVTEDTTKARMMRQSRTATMAREFILCTPYTSP